MEVPTEAERMVHSMFNTLHKPRRREPGADSDRRRQPWIGLRNDKDAVGAATVHEPFVDPVHGRHCICARCVQQRAA